MFTFIKYKQGCLYTCIIVIIIIPVNKLVAGVLCSQTKRFQYHVIACYMVTFKSHTHTHTHTHTGTVRKQYPLICASQMDLSMPPEAIMCTLTAIYNCSHLTLLVNGLIPRFHYYFRRHLYKFGCTCKC